MGRFHQPEKYDPTAAAVNPVTEPAPALSAPIPQTPPLDSRVYRNVRVEVEGSNPLAQVGFVTTLLYMFGVYSLSEELSISFFGVKPYLTTITGVIALIAATFSGGFGNIFKFGPAKVLIAFTGWLAVTIPFSTWRGGSWDTVSSFLTKSLLPMAFLLMTVTTWKQIRLFLYTMSAAALILAVAVRASAVDLSASDPRLAFSVGRLANPNDLATHMMTLLPFAVGLFFLSGRFSLLRPISAIVTIGTLYTVLQTGSRGALLSLVAIAALTVWKLPNAVHRVALVVGALVFVAIMAPMLPSSVIERYKLLLADDTAVPSNLMESQALESSESRRAVLIRSIKVTLLNPIFGIGPGNFATAEAETAKQQGTNAAWLQTHNGYTQVSSEAGLPAFILFTVAVIACLRTSSRYYRKLIKIPEFRGEAVMFLVIFMSLASFAINLCFSSLAYTFYIPAMAGVLGALVLVVDRELAVFEKQRAEGPSQPVGAAAPFWAMFNPRRLKAS